jgi:Na+/melibiose symporter-like transporter
MRAINKRLGRKITMLLGLVFVVSSTLLFWFIYDIKNVTMIQVTLIIACILLGIGTSTTNICSFSLTSDLIGLNTESGAFVYGIMSFADKLANGVIIAMIQQFKPCPDDTDIPAKSASYYRKVLSFIPAGVAVLTALMILSIWRTTIGGNRHDAIEPNQTHSIRCRNPSFINGNYNERTSLII